MDRLVTCHYFGKDVHSYSIPLFGIFVIGNILLEFIANELNMVLSWLVILNVHEGSIQLLLDVQIPKELFRFI